MSIFTAVMITLAYWTFQAKVWYGLSIMRMPLSIAPIMGPIFNDTPTALSAGATLQMIYIGSIAPGGNPPVDEGLASCITIPIALTAGIKPEIAISLAIPLGSFGVVLENVHKTLNITFIHMADRYVEKGDIKGIQRAAIIYPLLLAFPMRLIPVFIVCLYGPDAIASFANLLPAWSTNGLAIAGNILPTLSFAITIIVTGKKQYIPLFIIGLFPVTYSDLNTTGISIFGLCVISLYMQPQNTKGTKNG